MRVIGFYTTGTPYEQECQELMKILEKQKVNYSFKAVEPKGSWELNCGMKSSVLQEFIEDYDDDLLYLDVDARPVRELPIIKSDVPGICWWTPKYHGPQGEVLSGTIFLPNNDNSKNLISHWISEQKTTPTEMDQRVLQRIYKSHPHFLMNLDWINIVGFQKGTWLLQTDNPIIVHTQASRRFKNDVRTG
jgi:hypothetical protein